MKWLIRIVIVLVVIIGAGLWFGWSQLGNLVKFGIEQGTPPVVQTSVSVRHVNVSPFSGSGLVEDFQIDNPKGFTGPYALRIGRAEVGLDLNSVSADKVVIQHIRITDPEINLEAGPGGTNLKHIADNAMNFVSQQTAPAGNAAVPAADGKPKKSVKLQVNELLITGATLSASAAGLVPGAGARMTLPEIRLTNLGTGAAGITPAELMALILRQLNTEAVKASASGALKNMLQGGADKLKTDGIKGLFGK
ncbi:hypothetical protein [Prosthecobacter sp.]|uniref:hypothetical protein n=1 Tax=Prosthecobacter sp. TaxID=1965333 RepID=UPI003784C3D3